MCCQVNSLALTLALATGVGRSAEGEHAVHATSSWLAHGSGEHHGHEAGCHHAAELLLLGATGCRGWLHAHHLHHGVLEGRLAARALRHHLSLHGHLLGEESLVLLRHLLMVDHHLVGVVDRLLRVGALLGVLRHRWRLHVRQGEQVGRRRTLLLLCGSCLLGLGLSCFLALVLESLGCSLSLCFVGCELLSFLFLELEADLLPLSLFLFSLLLGSSLVQKLIFSLLTILFDLGSGLWSDDDGLIVLFVILFLVVVFFSARVTSDLGILFIISCRRFVVLGFTVLLSIHMRLPARLHLVLLVICISLLTLCNILLVLWLLILVLLSILGRFLGLPGFLLRLSLLPLSLLLGLPGLVFGLSGLVFFLSGKPLLMAFLLIDRILLAIFGFLSFLGPVGTLVANGILPFEVLQTLHSLVRDGQLLDPFADLGIVEAEVDAPATDLVLGDKALQFVSKFNLLLGDVGLLLLGKSIIVRLVFTAILTVLVASLEATPASTSPITASSATIVVAATASIVTTVIATAASVTHLVLALLTIFSFGVVVVALIVPAVAFRPILTVLIVVAVVATTLVAAAAPISTTITATTLLVGSLFVVIVAILVAATIAVNRLFGVKVLRGALRIVAFSAGVNDLAAVLLALWFVELALDLFLRLDRISFGLRESFQKFF